MNKTFWSITIVVGIILAITTGSAVYFFLQYRRATELTLNPSLLAQRQGEETIARVQKLILLPTNENPSIEVITDITKFTQIPFFTKAQNGDQLLIYPESRQAILYRPGSNVIVNVAPLVIDQPETTATASSGLQEAQLPINLAIYQGTQDTQASAQFEQKLAKAGLNFTVVDRKPAKILTYSQTHIVLLHADKKPQGEQLATALGGILTTMPKGESTPSADILIIVGADQ